MLREEGIEEIYDGRFYSPDDLVPVGCSGCEGCSDCCRNTGDTIPAGGRPDPAQPDAAS